MQKIALNELPYGRFAAMKANVYVRTDKGVVNLTWPHHDCTKSEAPAWLLPDLEQTIGEKWDVKTVKMPELDSNGYCPLKKLPHFVFAKSSLNRIYTKVGQFYVRLNLTTWTQVSPIFPVKPLPKGTLITMRFKDQIL